MEGTGSPMAEAGFRYTANESGYAGAFARIDSCGTSAYRLGESPDSRMSFCFLFYRFFFGGVWWECGGGGVGWSGVKWSGVDVWMHGCMDVWMDGWMDAWRWRLIEGMCGCE